MKKSFKLGALITCATTFLASAALSVGLGLKSTVKTHAETVTGVFEMEGGAGVQLTEGKDGLRFKAKMSQDYYDMLVTNDPNDDVLIYGYIAPVNVLEGIENYADLIDNDTIPNVGGELDQDKIYFKDGYYWANVVLTKLYANSFQDKSFSCIVFIEDNSVDTEYIYADIAKDETDVENFDAQNRTQYEVINAAFLDAEEDYHSALLANENYGEWFGTETYPIVISTMAQYDGLVAKLAADENFKSVMSDKCVHLSNAIAAEVANKSEDEQITKYISSVENVHVVKFLDGYRLLKTAYVVDGDSAEAPNNPTRTGYKFISWIGDYTNVTADTEIYAKWQSEKVKTDLGNITVYGASLTGGGAIATEQDLIGNKVVLASGNLGDAAYYPGETDSVPDPTDENNTADQAYIAYDGSYGFNDYFVADFTGKNMPTLAFFANNYNNSIFYGDGTKNGVVVSTGLTLPHGLLFTEGSETGGPFCTSVWDGKGLAMWGPHMIYSTAKNNDPKGVLLHSNVENVAIGRANLVDGTKYRVIMGFQPGDDASNKAIKLVYVLYDLSTDTIVESGAYNTYNFFADGWANAGQTRDQFCQGSIVAYGYFGTTTVLDKTYPIYEDTTINDISRELGMTNANNTTLGGDALTLGSGSIGSGANYTIGQNAGGSITQSYFALEGDYGYNDYVAFDFTGKNMPEVMFFAKNYDTSMYYSEGKQGVVVASGITLWDGTIGSAQTNNTKVGVSGPFGAYYEGAAAPYGGNMLSDFEAKLARANLEDDKQYRVIMGFTKASDTTFSLKYMLYNLTDDVVVEEVTQTSWAFFTGANEAVNNMTLDSLSGSIVLYGKFNATCTIDKLYGVFEDTDIPKIATSLSTNLKTVTFNNYDGTLLQEVQLSAGATPEYGGETPYKPGDAVYKSYTFTGWDKELTAITDDVTYTAVFTGTERDDVTMSGDPTHTYGVEQTNNKIVLKASGLGDGANYTTGQNNGGYVHQSYVALDGSYALNDYVALDFTGKNLPEIAFFANNYNDSMYAEGTSKQGIVVVTGITTWDGQLSSGVNGNGTQINYGFPYMIQDAASGSFCSGAFANSALGRANLVDGTHYRVIMGFTGSGSAITLNWYLYNLDTGSVVEQSSMTTWDFFTGSNAQVGNMTINDLSGSIVLYGKFGVACTIDKLYGVFEDTNIDAVAAGLNGSATYTVKFQDENGNVLQESTLPYGAMPEFKGVIPSKENTIYNYVGSGWDKAIKLVTGDVTYTVEYDAILKQGYVANNTAANGDGIVLNNGNIGDNAHYSGSNNLSDPAVIGTVNQSYLAFDGNYGLNDYVAFDFTGKNMPSVAFFANNYNESMYYQNGDKYGLVVLTGLTTWQGVLYTENNDSKSVWDGKGLLVAGPQMLHNTLNSGKNGVLGFQAVTSNSGDNTNVALGRANLEDGKQYRIIMGMEAGGNYSVKIVYMLYSITDDEVIETFSAETYNFFTDGFAKDGQTRDEFCQGSILLYGHFGTPTTIDKVYGVFEDTTLTDVAKELLSSEDEGSGDGSGEGSDEGSESTLNMLGYDQYSDQFDFYAYSAYSDGTYEIGGEKYYVGKNLANLKQYSLYGEAGLTIYFPQNDVLINGSQASITNAKKLLDDLAEVGITKTILQDSRILYLSMIEGALPAEYDTDDELDAYIYECIKDYADYPGVYGIQLGDEPKYSMLTAYSSVYKSIKRVSDANGYNLHIQYNLNPLNVTETVYTNYYPATEGTYAWGNYRYTIGLRDIFTDCVTRYTQYINDFLTAMEPDSIMYDDYPLMEAKAGSLTISESYIPCLQIVAKAAADRGIDFYNVTQAFENNADGTIHRRAITEAGAKWLNNILLGFGVKQIAYYTYYTRSESDVSGGESYIDGKSFVDYNGNPTDLYYDMQAIMENNQKFAPTVLQFKYKGSRTYGSADHFAEITVSNSFTKLSSFSYGGAALVTELYDEINDHYMYMAMNAGDPDTGSKATLTMNFNGYTMALVYDGNGNFTNEALSGGEYSATLNAGEAVFVIPYN